MKYFIVFFAIFAAFVQAVVFDRPCRTPEEFGVRVGFSLDLYLGRWYGIERYEHPSMVGSDCTTPEYTLNADGSVNVFNQGFIIETQTRVNATGRAVISFPDENPIRAMLNVTFGSPRNLSNYWILSTDYVNYAFVVSCADMPATNQSRESYWLLSRSATLSAASRSTADQLIDRLLERSSIRATVQDPVTCGRLPGRLN